MGILNFLKNKTTEILEENQRKKDYLLQWQNTVLTDKTTSLIMTEQQLKEATIQQADNDLRIINDCKKLIETTLKTDVFFMRLNLFVEKAKHLSELEKYITFSGASPTAAYNEIKNDYHKAINQFLYRYFSDTFDKAENMKTEKGKIGKYQKFYDSLQEYYCYMNDENIDYIETKYKAYTKHLTKN